MSIDLTWPLTSDGAGAVTYTANEWRTLLTNLFTEGILGSESFAVSERALGANMTVDIAAGVAVLAGDDAAGQGNYLIEGSETLSGATIPTADGSNPRIDLIGIQLRDPSEGGSAGRDAVFSVVSGTAAASPAAPSVPDSFLLLASVLVPAGATSIDDGDITDERSPARLAHDVVAAASITTAKLVDDAVTDAKVGAPTTGSLDSGKIRYARMGNIVHVWTTDASAGATLPVGFRPAAVVEVPGTTGVGSGAGEPHSAYQVSISPSGTISSLNQVGDPLTFAVSFSTV